MRTGHHLETGPPVWGHTNINRCLFCSCFMFVWPHVGSPLTLWLFGVRCRNVSTLQMPVHDVHSIGPSFSSITPLLSPVSCYPQSPPRSLFPRYARKLSNGFSEMEGFPSCVCCLVVNTLFSRVGCPFQRLINSSGKGGTSRQKRVC